MKGDLNEKKLRISFNLKREKFYFFDLWVCLSFLKLFLYFTFVYFINIIFWGWAWSVREEKAWTLTLLLGGELCLLIMLCLGHEAFIFWVSLFETTLFTVSKIHAEIVAGIFCLLAFYCLLIRELVSPTSFIFLIGWLGLSSAGPDFGGGIVIWLNLVLHGCLDVLLGKIFGLICFQDRFWCFFQFLKRQQCW